MRISDWSSDVCSSDLGAGLLAVNAPQRVNEAGDRRDALQRIAVRDDDFRAGKNVQQDVHAQQVMRRLQHPAFGADPALALLPLQELQTAAQERVDHRLVLRIERSEEHTSELPSLMRTSYAVFCLKKKTKNTQHTYTTTH